MQFPVRRPKNGLALRAASVLIVSALMLSIGGTFIQFWFGLGIALLLNSQLRGMSAARVLLILPTTIAPIVVGFLFRYMYYEGSGLITWLLTLVGFPVPAVGLLGSANTALPAIALADIWQWTPFFAIVLYAGLLSIPDDIQKIPVEVNRAENADELLFRGL